VNQRRCNYLVVTSLPVAAMVCASAVAVAVAAAAATVQQRQRWRGKGFYGRACSIARPHRSREKPARRRGSAARVRVTEREAESRERVRGGERERERGTSEKPGAESGRERTRDRTERERQKARWKEEVCIRTRHPAIVAPGKSGMRKSAAAPVRRGPSFSLSRYITNSRLYRSRQLSFVYSQLSTFLSREEEEDASPEFIPKLV